MVQPLHAPCLYSLDDLRRLGRRHHVHYSLIGTQHEDNPCVMPVRGAVKIHMYLEMRFSKTSQKSAGGEQRMQLAMPVIPYHKFSSIYHFLVGK